MSGPGAIGREFVCRGCYRICPGNPRLKAGEQEYCSRHSCQRSRIDRWERERLRLDEEYRLHRREAKAASRRKCAAKEGARRCETRTQERADAAQAGLPEPPAASPPPAVVPPLVVPQPAGSKVPIQPGWFLVRPADAPESATQTVEISVVWSCPSPTIEQVSSAPETDAFLLHRSASCMAEKGAA